MEVGFYHFLDNGKIQCDVCSRECKLSEGQRGACYVRGRQNNKMVLHTYGYNIGMAVDPIEKKPLYHFLPSSKVLSFGTAGCNLSCSFCQNWSMSNAKSIEKISDSYNPIEIAEQAVSLQCDSVAFTYNDPVVFLEYAVDTAIECRKRNIKTVAVTAGYINSGAREKFFSYMDAVNIDLKSFSNDFYKRLCKGQLQVVLDTLLYLKKINIWFEITNLIIPDENDSEEEIYAMTKWIYENLGGEIPLHFSAFHPAHKLQDTQKTSLESLLKAKKIAEENNIQYIYLGNVNTETGQNTICSNCGNVLIERNYYRVKQNKFFNGGICSVCKNKISGVWN